MPKYLHSNGGKIEQCFGTAVVYSIVFRLKMQKSTVLVKKKILSAVWIKLKCRWLQSGLADLEKHQTLAVFICLWQIFYAFLK